MFNERNIDGLQNAITSLSLAYKKNHGKNLTKECKGVSAELKKAFNCDFEYKVINMTSAKNSKKPMFLMSVFPEVSTVDAIVANILAVDPETGKDVAKIKTYEAWRHNNKWTIEVDSRILANTQYHVTNRELTAITLHEVGHVLYSDTIVDKITTTLRFKASQSPIQVKGLFADKAFANIVSLPILDMCIGDKLLTRKSLQREIRADRFAKKYGYDKELYDVMGRIIDKNKKSSTMNSSINKNMNFSAETLDNFYKRRDNLAKKSLLSLREGCSSEYINSVIDTSLFQLFGENMEENKVPNHCAYMHERAEEDFDKYVTEGIFGGKKKVKPITSAELDYITITIGKIQDENDRLMIVTYIHSKLDLVDYYMSILNDPELSKKYEVPQSMGQLQSIQKRLLVLRLKALEYKIPRYQDVLVAWPKGYEG